MTNAQIRLCQSALASLEWFCRLSGAEIEENYPQHLHEDYALNGPREICANLRTYICMDKDKVCEALRSNSNLQTALRELVCLQSTLVPTSAEPTLLQSQLIIWPTISLSRLSDEIEESARFILEMLSSTDLLIHYQTSGFAKH